MEAVEQSRPYCALPPRPDRAVPADLPHDRQRAILAGGLKWVNGTVLRYSFFTAGQLAIPEEQQKWFAGHSQNGKRSASV
jgi:hypothetical protein